MQNGDVAKGDVHQPRQEIKVPGEGYGGLPDVLINGVAVEIRGEAAGLMVEILGGWVESQQRRAEFLRRKAPGDGEARKAIRGIEHRVRVVQRVMRAWEGVLSLPKENPKPDIPEN
jgi:hypothetical protein